MSSRLLEDGTLRLLEDGTTRLLEEGIEPTGKPATATLIAAGTLTATVSVRQMSATVS